MSFSLMLLSLFSASDKRRRERSFQSYRLPALPVLLALTGLLAWCPARSWAGHWVVTYSGTATMVGMPAARTTPVGTETVVFSNSQITSDTFTGDPTFQQSQFSLGGDDIASGYYEQGNDKLSVAATLTWTQDSIYDTSDPPGTVS